MPKRLFRRYLPSPERLRGHKSLRFLGGVLSDPNLWHINRHSLAGAAFIGVFAGLLPIPMQMALAAILAVRFRCNLPLSVVLVWLSNPLTYVPIFYFTYRIGAWMMGLHPTSPHGINVEWFVEQLVPLWVGSLTCAVLGGLLSYLAVKLFWRLAVIRSWRRRRVLRRRKTEHKQTP